MDGAFRAEKKKVNRKSLAAALVPIDRRSTATFRMFTEVVAGAFLCLKQKEQLHLIGNTWLEKYRHGATAQ